MKHHLTALSLSLMQASLFAQTLQPAGKPAPLAPVMTMTQGIYVDRTTFARPRSAANTTKVYVSCDLSVTNPCYAEIPNVNTAGTTGTNSFGQSISGNTGEFRVNCSFAKLGFDDPIVHPSTPGVTHLHAFFGSTATSSTPDFDLFATTGTSTCDGGIANRTGYWAPPLVYHCPAGSTNGCDRKRDGEVQVPETGNFYYKITYFSDDVEWFPVGHRMIVGDPNATTENSTPRPPQIECYARGTPILRVGHVPTPSEGIAADPQGQGCDELNFFMQYPECWDGTNLDAPDHISHMAYANAYFGCAAKSKEEADANLASNLSNHDPRDPSTQWPPRFPHHLPSMTVNMHTAVRNADLAFLRLSSDPPASSGRPAGYTLHTDRVEGFSVDPNFAGSGKTVKQIIIDECYHAKQSPVQHVDCHDDNLGQIFHDGRYFRLGR